MLTLTRSLDQAVRIGPHVVKVKRITGSRVEIVVDVAADVRVQRGPAIAAPLSHLQAAKELARRKPRHARAG